jgi:alpha-glucosidase
VDGFRLDTVNFYFCSLGLESNPVVKPEDFNASTAPAVNPYNFQEHLFDKSRPENLAFLTRIRALMDEYPGKTTVGEIGDSQHQLAIMAQYTSGDERLHMAYTFDYLGGVFSAEHFRRSIAATEAGAPDGWVCLAFSNHDVVRHVSRWAAHGQEAAFTRLAATLLLTMRGSVCLYQGEELGLREAELAFEDLVDPYGIEFWPQFKGRDGCRTPMVWQAHAANGAFSTASRTWLPVPAEHLVHAVDTQDGVEGSVLEFYRALLAFRKAHPALAKGSIHLLESAGDVLAFIRETAEERLLCVFNMGGEATIFAVPEGLAPHDMGCPGVSAAPIEGELDLEPFGSYVGVV